jgi:hypothetical protein
VARVVEHLPSKHEDLSLNSSATKRKKKIQQMSFSHVQKSTLTYVKVLVHSPKSYLLNLNNPKDVICPYHNRCFQTLKKTSLFRICAYMVSSSTDTEPSQGVGTSSAWV